MTRRCHKSLIYAAKEKMLVETLIRQASSWRVGGLLGGWGRFLKSAKVNNQTPRQDMLADKLEARSSTGLKLNYETWFLFVCNRQEKNGSDVSSGYIRN